MTNNQCNCDRCGCVGDLANMAAWCRRVDKPMAKKTYALTGMAIVPLCGACDTAERQLTPEEAKTKSDYK